MAQASVFVVDATASIAAPINSRIMAHQGYGSSSMAFYGALKRYRGIRGRAIIRHPEAPDTPSRTADRRSAPIHLHTTRNIAGWPY